MRLVRSKGTNIRGVLSSLKRAYGDVLHAEVLRSIEGELGEALRHGAIVSSGWYPIAWHDETLAAIEAALPFEQNPIRKLTYDSVKRDFQTIFRVVSLVASPTFALPTATKVMARYYDGGRLSIPEARDGRVRFVFEDYFGFTRRLWDDVHGGLEGVVDLMGVERLPFEVSGGHGPKAEIVVHYKVS